MRSTILCISAAVLSVDAFAPTNLASASTRTRAPLVAMFDAPVVMGTEEMMSQKEHGTSAVPIQKNLRWSCDVETADRICNFNRHYAEYGGYWERATTFLKEESEASGEITFCMPARTRTQVHCRDRWSTAVSAGPLPRALVHCCER